MFEEIDVNSLELNPFTTLGKDNFLITAQDERTYNTMTAAWGFFGFMWKKPAFAIVVRPSRYTHSFIENSSYFTVSFFDNSYYETLQYCGKNSGRDVDKAKECGLKAVTLEFDDLEFPTFEQANMVLCCKKASRTQLESANFIDKTIEEHYADLSYHTLYIGFIEKIVVQES